VAASASNRTSAWHGKAGICALAQGIFERFKEINAHAANVTVAVVVTTAEDGDAVVEEVWRLYSQMSGS
jgi:hypothetical protein